MKALLVLLLGILSAEAYTWLSSPVGNLRRNPAFSFVLDPDVASGLRNREGRAILAAESDPAGALAAAAATWSSIPTSAISLSVIRGASHPNPADGINSLCFDDTPESRSVIGSAVAVTMVIYDRSGEVIDSDILFNPELTFATTPALDAFDLQAVATHEMGHALGAGHSLLMSAAMMKFSAPGDDAPRWLGSDDVALMSILHPKADAREPVGRISGTVTFAGGGPVREALVVAIDPETGFAASSLSGGDGAYTIAGLPPGSYCVLAQPPPGMLDENEPGDGPGWPAAFAGGDDPPRRFPVTGGATAGHTDVVVADGQARFSLDLATTSLGAGAETLLPSGAETEVTVFGTGLPERLAPEDVLALGPGVSVRAAAAVPSGALRITLSVEARGDWADAVIAVRSGASWAALSGLRIRPHGPVLTPAGVVHAATYLPGGVAPGEIVSIFGAELAPAVTFDGVAAPVFYASPIQLNVQVPYEVAGRESTRVRVDGGQSAAEVVVPVVEASPGIFNGAIFNQDGTPNTSQRPAWRGSIVVAYGTGIGPVDPPLQTGVPAPVSPLSRAPGVTASMGGLPAPVHFAGMTPGFMGLFQLNIQVPDGAGPGLVPLQYAVREIPGAWPAPVHVIETRPSSVALAWTDNSDNELQFPIERCEGPGCEDFVQIAAVDVNVTTYTDTDVKPGVTYSYRVRASNASGDSAYSNVATASMPPLPR